MKRSRLSALGVAAAIGQWSPFKLTKPGFLVMRKTGSSATGCPVAGGLLLSMCLLIACHPPQQQETLPYSNHAPKQAASALGVPNHDLSQDEAAGGHTLRKHVGRSDDELRKRLQHEPGISAASTYIDRQSAEHAVGIALDENRDRIQSWLQRSGGHPNLVLDYKGNPNYPIGRSLRHGEEQSQPCPNAVIVLRWEGPDQYYVLTSYPECR
jgi:hypothetical protein